MAAYWLAWGFPPGSLGPGIPSCNLALPECAGQSSGCTVPWPAASPLEAHLAPLPVRLANCAEQRVRAQEDVRTLRPLAAHQAVLAQEDGAHVLGAAHADHRPAQQVRLEHRPVALPAGAVEARALSGQAERRVRAEGSRVWPSPSPLQTLGLRSFLQAGAQLLSGQSHRGLATTQGAQCVRPELLFPLMREDTVA